MTNEIVLSNITGIDAPYNVFGCDIYGNNCILIATIDRDIPPPLTLPLSPIFNTYPGLLLKLSNCSGCVDSEYLSCIEQPLLGLCFNLGSEANNNYPCHISPSGYHNTKPYYRLLDPDCSVPHGYLWWNNTNMRWEVTNTLGSGFVCGYLNNPGNYPESTQTYNWVNGDPTPCQGITVISSKLIDDCPEPMCFNYNYEPIGGNSVCTTKYYGYHNNKPYYKLLYSNCNEFPAELDSIYVWWNSSNMRWEVTTTLGSGLPLNYLNNPGNYPVSTNIYSWDNTGQLTFNYSLLGECPTMCIWWVGESIVGDFSPCETNPSGYHNGKLYYQMLDTNNNCSTTIPRYIWWNSGTTRWELTETLGSGEVKWYNENPGNYPEGTSEYLWVWNGDNNIPTLSVIFGDCPELMCFAYYTEPTSISSCGNIFPIGIHNGKYYYGFMGDLCGPFFGGDPAGFYLYWETSTSRWEIRTGIGSGTLYSYLTNPDDYPVATDVYNWNNTQPAVFEMLGSDFGSSCYSEA